MRGTLAPMAHTARVLDIYGRPHKIKEVPITGPVIVAGTPQIPAGYGGTRPAHEDRNRDLTWREENGDPTQPSAYEQMVNVVPQAGEGIDRSRNPIAQGTFAIGEAVDDTPAAAMQQAWWTAQVTKMGKAWQRIWRDATWCFQDRFAPFLISYKYEHWTDGDGRYHGVFLAFDKLEYFPGRAVHSVLEDFDSGELLGYNVYERGVTNAWHPKPVLQPHIFLFRNQPKGRNLGKSDLRSAYAAWIDLKHAAGARWDVLAQCSALIATLAEGDTEDSARAKELMSLISQISRAPGGSFALRAGELVDRLHLDTETLKGANEVTQQSLRSIEAATGAFEISVGQSSTGAMNLAETHTGGTKDRAHARGVMLSGQFETSPMTWLHQMNFGDKRPPPPLTVRGIKPKDRLAADQSAAVSAELEAAHAGKRNQEQLRINLGKIAPQYEDGEIETMTAPFPTQEEIEKREGAERVSEATPLVGTSAAVIQALGGTAIPPGLPGSFNPNLISPFLRWQQMPEDIRREMVEAVTQAPESTGEPAQVVERATPPGPPPLPTLAEPELEAAQEGPKMSYCGHRPLSEIELAAAIDADAMRADRDEAEAEITEALGTLRTEALHSYFDDPNVKNAMARGDSAWLLSNPPDFRSMDAKISAALRPALTRGSSEARREVEAVGEDAGDDGISAAQVDEDQRLTNTATQIRQQWQQGASQIAVEEAERIENSDGEQEPRDTVALIAAAAVALGAMSLDFVRRGVRKLWNIGRGIVQNLSTAQVYQYSTVAEGTSRAVRAANGPKQGVCPPCIEDDLTVARQGSPTYNSLNPPNPACLGKDRCNCFWSPVRADLIPPTLPVKVGAVIPG